MSDLFKRLAVVLPVLVGSLAGGSTVFAQSTTQVASGASDTDLTLRGLRVSPVLAPNPVAADTLPVYLGGDRMNVNPEGDLVIEGRGSVRRADTVLTAGYLHYNDKTTEVRARGNARLIQDGNVVIGPAMRYNLDADEGEIESPSFWFGTGGTGVGSKAVITNQNEMTIDDVTYSACPCPDPAWWLTASEVNLDFDANEGQAWWSVLYFKGVPILASPYFTFPIRKERKSGFLQPTFGISSRSGYEMTLPYYLNLAPNYDATIDLRPMSKRGLQLGGEFRYLRPSFGGTIAGTYLPNDNEFGKDRWLYSTQHSQSLGRGFYGGWNISGVSDDDYFKDFALLGYNEATTTFLPRSGWVGWRGQSWNARANYSTFQTLGNVKPQYNTVPAFTLNGSRYNYGGFDLVMNNSAIWFERQDRFGRQLGPNGQRYTSYPTIALPYIETGYFITPKVGLHVSHYNTNWQPSERNLRDASVTRAIPIMSLDAGMFFERDATYFGHAAIQTLEPRLYYLNVPFRDQSGLPVYDTALSDFSFAQAFQENIYTGGWDRIANANQLTAAVTTRFLGANTGAERASLSVGQRFYFEDQRVILPGERPRTDTKSDYLISGSANVTNNLSVRLDLQYDPYATNWDRAQIATRFNPKRAAAVTASYRYQRSLPGQGAQGQNQVSLAFQWPLTAQIYSVGRIDYSMLNRPKEEIFPRVTQALAGVEYRGDCCWAARFVFQRYAIDPKQVNNAFFFQLELSGMGRLGQDPLNLLGRSIPGYQNMTPSIAPVGKFERYE